MGGVSGEVGMTWIVVTVAWVYGFVRSYWLVQPRFVNLFLSEIDFFFNTLAHQGVVGI